jgi:hypothetical protein
MRAAVHAGLVLLLQPASVAAQTIVTSAAPDKVAVTVYRSDAGTMDLRWLNGFAMVSETRRVKLPAGDVDLRFEGVTGGIIPQSAIVTGLGDALVEKNRDAMLLSPGTLIASMLGQRVHLKRTSIATGLVVEQDAILRSGPNGVVIQTAAGIEALRCSGLSETIRADEVPKTLSSRPTLSSRLRLAAPVEANVTLTYLTNNFDWRAHYVGTVAPDGRSMSLFAWLTMANGDATSLAGAEAMAVAGRLNRERVDIPTPEVRPISLSCWPSGTTSDIDEEESYEMYGPPPPPPPAPPMPVAMRAPAAESIVVTGQRVMAQREALGDLKLYRIPIPVTVAAQSQKQVALLEQPKAQFASVARLYVDASATVDEPETAQRVLIFQNKSESGLGLPLPAGTFTLYASRDGRPFLLGEGQMTDRAEGEKVELPIDQPSGVRVTQRQLKRTAMVNSAELVVRNEAAAPATVELLFEDSADIRPASGRIGRRDGRPVWIVSIPANSSRTLRYTWRSKD